MIRRSEHGQTLIDLMVASGLLVVMVPVLILVLIVTETSFAAVTDRSNAQSVARRILSGVAREIRSARSVGWCPSAPPGQQFVTPASTCLHVAQYRGRPPGAEVPGGPIIFQDADQLWFWDYSEVDGSLATSFPIGVPDCVNVHARPDRAVLVDRWAGRGTFTTASCPGVSFPIDGSAPTTSGRPATSRYVGALSANASTSIFTATDRDGAKPTLPEDVALVTIAPVFTVRPGLASASAITFTVTVEAAVRGTIYEQEQTWNAT